MPARCRAAFKMMNYHRKTQSTQNMYLKIPQQQSLPTRFYFKILWWCKQNWVKTIFPLLHRMPEIVQQHPPPPPHNQANRIQSILSYGSGGLSHGRRSLSEQHMVLCGRETGEDAAWGGNVTAPFKSWPIIMGCRNVIAEPKDPVIHLLNDLPSFKHKIKNSD